MRSRELEALFSKRSFDCRPWIRGKIPKHYKRMSCSWDEAIRLAKIGAARFAAYYGQKLHFSQSVIAGAILTGDYDLISFVASPQYGKTWLYGRIALLLAYFGKPVYIAGATADKTGMMMSQVLRATQEVAPEVRNALTMKKDEIDRLTQSLSKKRIGFSGGGFVEPITLGDAYGDVVSASQAVGRSGVYLVDEAALPSEKAMQELDRRRFSDIDGVVYPMAMVSNPHKPGYFYDKITEDPVPERSLVLWMDILTAVEEERWTEEKVWTSDWVNDKGNLRRYLLCVLDTDGSGMFDDPKVSDEEIDDPYAQYFLGIDSAYKGKDNICLALSCVYEKDGKARVRVVDIETIDKKVWVDGKTSDDIVSDIQRVIRNQRVVYTCVDIGQGIWLVEGLTSKGEAVKGINFSERPTPERVSAKQYSAVNAQNKRAEMHLDLANLIEDGSLEFSSHAYQKVKDILPYVVAERKSNGKILIRPKSEIKVNIGRSPDELDSVILSIHAMMRFMGESVTYIT